MSLGCSFSLEGTIDEFSAAVLGTSGFLLFG